MMGSMGNIWLELLTSTPIAVALVWAIKRYQKVTEEKNAIQEKRIQEASNYIQLMNDFIKKLDEMALLSNVYNDAIKGNLTDIRKDIANYQARLLDEIKRLQ